MKTMNYSVLSILSILSLTLTGCVTEPIKPEKAKAISTHDKYIATKISLEKHRHSQNQYKYSKRPVTLVIKENQVSKMEVNFIIDSDSKIYINQEENRKNNKIELKNVVITKNLFSKDEIFEFEATIYNHYGNEYLNVIFAREVKTPDGRKTPHIATYNFTLGSRGVLVEKIFNIPAKPVYKSSIKK